MRLIDADKLKAVIIEEYKEEFFGSVLWDILNDIPTAYDIDKVVEELKDVGNRYCANVGCDNECKDCPHWIQTQKEIEIVKAGVKNDCDK